MELVLPSMDYRDSYLAYIAELGDEERYPFPLDFDCSNFAEMLIKIDTYAQGIGLPTGFVPSSTWWLVDAGELLGVSNLRHYLNPALTHCGGHIGLGIRPSYRAQGLGKRLMKLSIEKLTALGVNPVHIHCYKDNVASARTIAANGGTLMSEILHAGKCVQRYRVDCR